VIATQAPLPNNCTYFLERSLQPLSTTIWNYYGSCPSKEYTHLMLPFRSHPELGRSSSLLGCRRRNEEGTCLSLAKWSVLCYTCKNGSAVHYVSLLKRFVQSTKQIALISTVSVVPVVDDGNLRIPFSSITVIFTAGQTTDP